MTKSYSYSNNSFRMALHKTIAIICVLFIVSCSSIYDKQSNIKSTSPNNFTATKFSKDKSVEIKQEQNDSVFVNLKEYSNDFVYDLKYATTDNFLNQKVYDCDECYLRLRTINSLIKANNDFIAKGYRIKLFDCYRPIDVQKKMWEIVSNPNYVADPKKGSIHNRGGAIDITLVDSDGKELDMGTSFDHFGIESSHDYQSLSTEVLNNRKLLKEIMLKNNFKAFDSEWWHYNLKEANLFNLSNFKWNCK